jgi:sodium transport system ATP-binding protein
VIQVEGVEMAFGSRVVLSGLDFTVRDGEVVALVAGNGAGKTTCFRAIAGGLRPRAGRILLDGIAQETGPGRVPVSYGSAERVTWPGRTPRDVLRLVASLHGIGRRDARSRIDRVVASLGMAGFADRRSKAPSTGEAMKLTLARLLLQPTRNVLLDEPTAGLDHATVDAVHREVEALRAAGHAVVISSHRREDVAAMADRIVLIEGGRASASPSVAFERSLAASA